MSERIGLAMRDEAVVRSRFRINLSRNILQYSKRIVLLSRHAINSSRLLIDKTPPLFFEGTPESKEYDNCTEISARWSDEELDDLITSLIMAYEISQVRGDIEMEDEIRRALNCIGRYLAGEVGPKAAGIARN